MFRSPPRHRKSMGNNIGILKSTALRRGKPNKYQPHAGAKQTKKKPPPA